MPASLTPLGALNQLTDHTTHVTFTGQRGQIELTPLPHGLLRVRVGLKKRLPRYQSWAVGAEWLPAPKATTPLAPFSIKQTNAGATLNADGLTTHIQFDPVGLSFSRARGAAFAVDLAVGARGEQIAARKTLQPGEVIYGLGEKTGWLDKRHRRYKMRSADVLWERPEIGIGSDPLYASFPMFIAHSAQGSYGIFVDNPEFTEFDFGAEDVYEFSAPTNALTYYVLPGPTLPEVLQQYTALTGRMPLPALWTLGYHQCRWGYKDEADILSVTHELRARHIPADAVWLDIDYMDEYRVFTWDHKDFPHPAELTAHLKENGFRTVTIVDPGVKVDPKYAVYRAGKRAGHFIKHPSGKEYNGNVWPGRSAFPDFHRAETREWWAGLTQRWLAEYGLTGLWNDMNEPATKDITGPIMEVLHDGGTLPHLAARNTYALQMARATFAGMTAHAPDSRPFILSRSGFSGLQTVAALWCGDNHPYWEHLAGSLPMLMNLGLSGIPFVGVDVGGFAGDTHGELLARWTQAGAFYPFFRNHAVTGSNAHEPWGFGAEVEAICRTYIELRYRLLPYFYNVFYQAAQTGAPIMRPLVWHYPKDPQTFNLNDQFMVGSDLLVAPVVTPSQTARLVYLPAGQWWRVDEHLTPTASQPFTGPTPIIAEASLAELPLFVRGGAIIPTWPLAQHTDALQRAEVTLHLWPGDGLLNYYEDDGATQAHTRGAYRLTPFKLQSTDNALTLTWGKSTGHFAAERTEWQVVIHAAPTGDVSLDGRPHGAQRAGEALYLSLPDDGMKHSLTIA